VRENKHNQVVVINATLTRIERWFGAFHASTLPTGQVVLLLPEGLGFCQHCRRVRLPASMLADGHCQYCLVGTDNHPLASIENSANANPQVGLASTVDS
jgi:molybdenum cofactor biosynthesis enzyme MoaA